jgi:NAD(P)H-hydrate epimerase
LFVFGERAVRPLVTRAWRSLVQAAGSRVATVREVPEPSSGGGAAGYDLCLDGVFGFQFRPPADARVTALLDRVNALPIRLRAAVDLPSAGAFRADFTYATGSVKTPVVDAPVAGRVRYLDLGFFGGSEPGDQRVLTREVLAPLAALRVAHGDKRTYGHVLVVGGSRSFPGAILMTVLSALRSGAGVVTAFVPESVAPAFAARAPEAMWVGWPETPAGGLALEGEHLLRSRWERGTALVMGPGLGREPETLALAASIAKTSSLPLVIDADALQPDIVSAGGAARIVTPHAGEFARIRDAVCAASNITVVLKGPVTRISGGAGNLPAPAADQRGQVARATGQSTTYHSFFGGPVLARGGSGDILAGLIAGQLAQNPAEPLLAAARGVVWHGLAADLLARAQGQVAVSVTQLLDYLPAALREE